jgi:hypothetical protein
MSWLEYSQCILAKVGFDRRLFRKELRKSLRLLTPIERVQLLSWCRLQIKRTVTDSPTISVRQEGKKTVCV